MRLLWVDDDGPDRFLYERGVIEDDGWQVQWATSVEEAVEALKGTAFDALILDLNLTDERGVEPPYLIWGACRILYWLRQTPLTRPRPWLTAGASEVWSEAPPYKTNEKVPVLIVSGFHDDDVLKAIRDAGPADFQIKLLPKPVDERELLRWLGDVSEARRA